MRKINSLITDDSKIFFFQRPFSHGERQLQRKLSSKKTCCEECQFLQMLNQRSLQKLALSYGNKTIACKRLAQSLSRFVSVAKSLMSEYTDRVVKTDQCPQNKKYSRIVVDNAKNFTRNIRAAFECFCKVGLK